METEGQGPRSPEPGPSPGLASPSAEGPTIWFVFLGTLAVRLATWAGTYAFGTDSSQLLRMAELMRQGSWDAALKVNYHPGYPAAVALFSHLTGDLEVAGFLVSILFGSLAAVPLYLLTRDAFGRATAIVAVVLYGLHWQLVDVHVDVMTEGLYFAALFSAIWMGRRFIDTHRLAWSLGAGTSAAVAYLTRNEGVIAICGLACWFLFEAVRRRDRSSGDLFLGTVFAAGCFLIASMPFLLWVKGEMGRWTLTAKGSGQVLASAVTGESIKLQSNLFLKSLWVWSQAHRFVLLIPLAAGLAWAWREERWKRLFLLSWPVAYLAGVLYVMNGLGYVSYRYLLVPFSLLLPFIAWGIVGIVERAASTHRTRWMVGATMTAGLLVGFKIFDVHRWEDVPLARAGQWIREHTKKRPDILTTRDKVAWHARGNLKLAPSRLEDALAADFVVYTERDSQRREWAFMPELESDPRFERVKDDFTGGRKGQRAVRVYRVIKPGKTN